MGTQKREQLMGMVKGQKYQDVMDASRTVIPTGNGNECRINFDGVFVGKAEVPSSLFDERAKWYGFVLPGNEPWRRRDDNDDSYDEE